MWPNAERHCKEDQLSLRLFFNWGMIILNFNFKMWLLIWIGGYRKDYSLAISYLEQVVSRHSTRLIVRSFLMQPLSKPWKFSVIEPFIVQVSILARSNSTKICKKKVYLHHALIGPCRQTLDHHWFRNLKLTFVKVSIFCMQPCSFQILLTCLLSGSLSNSFLSNGSLPLHVEETLQFFWYI